MKLHTFFTVLVAAAAAFSLGWSEPAFAQVRGDTPGVTPRDGAPLPPRMGSAVRNATALVAVPPTPVPGVPVVPGGTTCQWGFVLAADGICRRPAAAPLPLATGATECWDANVPLQGNAGDVAGCTGYVAAAMGLPVGAAGEQARAAAGTALGACNDGAFFLARAGEFGQYGWSCTTEVEPTFGFNNYRRISVQIWPL